MAVFVSLVLVLAAQSSGKLSVELLSSAGVKGGGGGTKG